MSTRCTDEQTTSLKAQKLLKRAAYLFYLRAAFIPMNNMPSHPLKAMLKHIRWTNKSKAESKLQGPKAYAH